MLIKIVLIVRCIFHTMPYLYYIGGTTTHVNTVSIAEKPTSDAYVSVSQRAEQILKSRRAEYMKNAKAAKEANDKLSATEFLSVVKLFNQALGKRKLSAFVVK